MMMTPAQRRVLEKLAALVTGAWTTPAMLEERHSTLDVLVVRGLVESRPERGLQPGMVGRVADRKEYRLSAYSRRTLEAKR